MNTKETQTIQAVLNTLDNRIPVIHSEDVKAKLSCIMALRGLLAERVEGKEENDG